MITTVLLDLDDTILADDEATDAAFMATALQAGTMAEIDPHQLIVNVRSIAADEWLKGPFPDWLAGIGTSSVEGLRAQFAGEDEHWAIMREWGPGFRHRSWSKALAAMGVEDEKLASTLDALFEKERGETNPFCLGAEEALTRFGKKFRLGMVTNGVADVQRKKIETASLDGHFDAIVVSGELAVGKPNAAIYRHALKLLGATPEETIMVGDSYRADVLGPQALGIRGVWISMGREKPDHGEPWQVVESLADLPNLL